MELLTKPRHMKMDAIGGNSQEYRNISQMCRNGTGKKARLEVRLERSVKGSKKGLRK